MEVREYKFSMDDLDLHPEDIEEFIGYEAGQSPAPVHRLIKESLHMAQDHCEIRGGYIIRDRITVNREQHFLNIHDTELDVKKIIYGQLHKSESMAIFVCTAGEGIGHYSEKLMKQGDVLEGYIMDIIGSEIVEAAMDQVQDDLEEHLLKEELHITDRYSPGYCGWSVSEQQKLFPLLPEKFCGVSLTPHSLMQPIKSVSGIIGIGRAVSRKGYSCQVCEMANCIYRKKKN